MYLIYLFLINFFKRIYIRIKQTATVIIYIKINIYQSTTLEFQNVKIEQTQKIFDLLNNGNYEKGTIILDFRDINAKYNNQFTYIFNLTNATFIGKASSFAAKQAITIILVKIATIATESRARSLYLQKSTTTN